MMHDAKSSFDELLMKGDIVPQGISENLFFIHSRNKDGPQLRRPSFSFFFFHVTNIISDGMEAADLVTFTEEILNGKLQVLSSVNMLSC